MAFTYKIYKNISQDTLTFYNDTGYDLSAATSITATSYLTDINTPTATYNFTPTEITDLLTNDKVDIATSSILGASPADNYYTVSLDINTGADTGTGYVGITLTATAQVYTHQSLIDVRANKYDVDNLLHVSKILLDGMNALEFTDTTQGKNQFDNWNTRLQEMLGF